MAYIVTGAAAVVTIGSGGGTSLVKFIDQGGILPEGIDDKQIAHLLEVGLIAELDEPEAEPVVDDTPEFPEGDPAESWTVSQLDAYAAAKGVAVSGKKPEKVAALVAALESAE